MPSRLARRQFLRNSLAGTLVLPALPSLANDGLKGDASARTAPDNSRKRFVAVGNLLGFQRSQLFPETIGKEFELTKLLEPLADNRERITVYRGLDHGLKGGHFAVHTFLSGVLHHESKNRPDGNVTVDQFIADAIGDQTRFASLTVVQKEAFTVDASFLGHVPESAYRRLPDRRLSLKSCLSVSHRHPWNDTTRPTVCKDRFSTR